jgi:hypothetical protein
VKIETLLGLPRVVAVVKPLPLDQVFRDAIFNLERLDILDYVRLIKYILLHSGCSFEKLIHVTSPVTFIAARADWAAVFVHRLTTLARCNNMTNFEIEGRKLNVAYGGRTLGIEHISKLTKPKSLAEQRAFHRKLILGLHCAWCSCRVTDAGDGGSRFLTGECFTLININVAAQQVRLEVGHQVQGLAQRLHGLEVLSSQSYVSRERLAAFSDVDLHSINQTLAVD